MTPSPASMTVSDVVFNPDVTEFLKAAAARGAKTISGLGMLVCQGALNFTIWTGKEAPYDVMYEGPQKRICLTAVMRSRKMFR